MVSRIDIGNKNRRRKIHSAVKRKPREEVEFSDDGITESEPIDNYMNRERNDESGSDDGKDSDKELQIAFREGLLKTDRLNYMVQKKRPIINKTVEILAKIANFAKKLPWIETLDISVGSGVTKDIINDDFEREIKLYYKQAEEAVKLAVPRLLSMGVKILRPADYYAEMAKSDGHMQKVRKRLLEIQEGKEKQEAIRRMREEKKYASKVQKEVISRKNTEKKKLTEAVKKHKKGMKQQLEDMLNNVKRMGLDKWQASSSYKILFIKDDNENKSGSVSKQGQKRGIDHKKEWKSKKFGYGGKKKGKKRNDKERESSSLSMCNCVACGIFLSTCFLGLIPHVRHQEMMIRNGTYSMNKHDKPMAIFVNTELIVLMGFLLILLIEQSLLICSYGGSSVNSSPKRAAPSLRTLLESECEDGQPLVDTTLDTDEDGMQDIIFRSSSPVTEREACTIHNHALPPEDGLTARTLFLLLGLSIHSIFEGVALGIQKDKGDFINVLVAVMFHEVLCCVAYGVSMAQQRTAVRSAFPTVIILSASIPTGMLAAVLVDELDITNSVLLRFVLEGLAAGTFIYVACVEMLSAELGHSHGDGNLSHGDHTKMRRSFLVCLR
uniref:Zinc transporter ZIP3 n=1 Tax=Heterorhabditis bacteriophora TaxID=37862 RepID=A0A1I7XSY8_HETBA